MKNFRECNSGGIFTVKAEILKCVHRINLRLYKLVINSCGSLHRKPSFQRPSTASFSSAGARARYVTVKHNCFSFYFCCLKSISQELYWIFTSPNCWFFSRSITSYGAPQSKVNLVVEPAEVKRYLDSILFTPSLSSALISLIEK